jgi:hypothetical protein
VAVEKLDILEIGPNLGDRKCLGASRRSFIEHPGAIYFLRISRSEFFNISKYVDRVKVLLGYEFHEFEHTTRLSADALCPFDGMTSFCR